MFLCKNDLLYIGFYFNPSIVYTKWYVFINFVYLQFIKEIILHFTFNHQNSAKRASY